MTITRRQAAALLGAPLLLPRHAGAQPAPRRGGELAFGLDGAAVSSFVLDPHNSSFAPHARVIRSIFDSLVVLKPDGDVAPWLAASWDVSPDGTAYTFRLRPGVRFHDGTAFDAAAVKVNLDRVADPRNALAAQIDLGPYLGTDVLAEDTLRIRLSEPYAPLLRNLSKTTLAIISPTALQRHGDAIAQNPVGTGPFRFVSLNQGVDITIARNADYAWAPPTATNEGAPFLDRIVFRNVPEESTRVAALQSRQVQAVDALPPQHILGFRANPAFRLIEKELLNNNYTLYPNVAKAPWNDDDVRRAFQLSIDVDAITRVIYLGTQPRAWAPLSPGLFASADRELAGSWKHDPALAAQLLDRAGWRPGARGIREKDGRRLTVSFADTQGNREKRLDVIQLVRRQVQRTGFDLSIDSQPNSTYREKLANNDYDLGGASQFAPDPDVLRRLHHPAGRARASISKVNDAEISEWLVAGTREADPARRIALYHRVQRKLVERAYAIPIYVLLYNIASLREVQGITIDAHGFPEFHGAWIAA